VDQFVTAAAVMIQDLFHTLCWALNPGAVFAAVVASGSRPYPHFIGSSDAGGLGKIRLPRTKGAGFLSGAMYILKNEAISIEIWVPSGASNMKVGLWWPEDRFFHLQQLLPYEEPQEWGYPGVYEYHNRIGLYVVDPSGNLQGGSHAFGTVFQFTTVEGDLESGGWTIELEGLMVPVPQTVYFFLHFDLD